MERWLESVYSDGSEYFVSSPSPALGETVTVKLQVIDSAPLKDVFLRSLHNGRQEISRMRRAYVSHGLACYEGRLKMTENRIGYQFYLSTGEALYYYTQRGVTTYMPDHTCDFRLLADYVQPEWVKDAVFYQIFPERFCNGDETNDVQTGEYVHEGFKPVRMPSWDARPLSYEQGRCMDFYGGDLQGIRMKLPYLKRLGVTALYINPIFSAFSVHKYDCVDFFHVDRRFGGDEALAELTSAAHKLGIRVIIDISINHTGAENRWFNRAGELYPISEGAYNNPESEERGFYFFDKSGKPDYWAGVKSLPTLNYTSERLRELIYRGEDSVLRKWLKPPYNIDGWRFDVADTFARHDETQLAHELWPEIRRAIREERPDAYILAEDWGDCAEYLQGDEWDAPMNYFGCARVIRSFYGQQDHFLMWSPELRGVPCGMTGEEVRARVMQHLAKLPFVIQQNQFNLVDSHDIERLSTDPRMTPEMLRGAAVFQFMLTGAASIYYGDEAEIGGDRHTNEGCRWPMPWDRDIESTDSWRLYHALCALKAEHRALSRGGMKFLYAGDRVFSIARFTPEEAFAAVFSNSPEEETVRLDLGSIGAAPEGEALGGELKIADAGDGEYDVTLPPNGCVLISCRMV